jgi:hypothetical protein
MYAHLPLQNHDYIRHYVFAESAANGPPEGFSFLSEPNFFGKQGSTDVTFVGGMDAEATTYHFMNADALVSTGSSFPMAAAVASWKPLLFLGKPKEGLYGVHALCDSILMDDEGRLVEDSPSTVELRARAQSKYALFHHTRVPPGIGQQAPDWRDIRSETLCSL